VLKLRGTLLALVILGLALPNVASAVSQTVIDAVVQRAQRAGDVETVEAVETTAAGASIANGGEPNQTGQPGVSESNEKVDLVVVHGQFEETDVPIPQGARPPTGSVIAFTVRVRDGELESFYVGDRSPALQGSDLCEPKASSGPPVQLLRESVHAPQLARVDDVRAQRHEQRRGATTAKPRKGTIATRPRNG
jgi:hypothetical protein